MAPSDDNSLPCLFLSNSAWALVVPLPYFFYCSRIKFKVETISYRHLFYIKMRPSDRRALPSLSFYNSITSTTSCRAVKHSRPRCPADWYLPAFHSLIILTEILRFAQDDVGGRGSPIPILDPRSRAVRRYPATSPILPGDFSTLVEMTMWRPPDLDPNPDRTVRRPSIFDPRSVLP